MGQSGASLKTGALQDSIPVSKTHTNLGTALNFQDSDPYFMETTAINSAFGPGSIVRNIVQDKNGHYWFATWEGIVRYDGSTFTNFTNKAGLRRYHTFSVMEDKAGNLWFGTIGAGVYRYDGQVFANFTKKDGLADDNIGCIYQDKAGAIWIGTFKGASRYDGRAFVNFTTNEGMDINSIIEDKNGKIWVAARENLYLFDGKSFSVYKNEEGLPFINVRSIIEDKSGNLWFGGQDGLHLHNGKHFATLSKDFVGFLYEDKKGNVWMSSSSPQNGMALSRFDAKTLATNEPKAVQITRENGQVFGILEDTDENIWYGTEHGVCRFDGKGFTCFSEAEAKK